MIGFRPDKTRLSHRDRPTLASWRNSQPFGFPLNFTQTRDSLPPPVTQLFCSLQASSQLPAPRSKVKPLLTAITSAMIFRGRQLSHLRLPRLAFRQGEPLPIYADRVSVSFNTLCGRCYITPISHRSYADKPVSRPKAHSGRTTTAPSKRAPTATSVAVKKKSTRAKKPAAKKKAKPTPRRKAKSKAKPKGRSKTKSRKVLTKEQKKELAARKKQEKEKLAARKKQEKEKLAARKKQEKEKLAAKKKKEKEKLVANKAKQKIQDLKTTALDPPKHGPPTVWATLLAEGLKEPGSTVKNRTPEIAARYKALSPERREHYNRIVLREKAATEAAYRQWLESYTPDQIRLANNARVSLRKKGMKKYPKLADERQVKKPLAPHIYFIKDRQATAAYAAIKPLEKMALLCKEWSAAPAAEKKKFEDMASQDRQRYVEEMKAVYNLNVSPKGSPARPQYAT
ncbi:hypothetical protein MMC22_002668 [Lobaria immixta]|nr:hypothetical protein [Lobaria immixta]